MGHFYLIFLWEYFYLRFLPNNIILYIYIKIFLFDIILNNFKGYFDFGIFIIFLYEYISLILIKIFLFNIFIKKF